LPVFGRSSVPNPGLLMSGLPMSGFPKLGRSPPGLGRVKPLEMSPNPGRPRPELMLPKLGRLLIPGETPGREPTDGGLTLGREMDGVPVPGLEPRSKPGLLLTPSDGRETDGPGLGPGEEGRLLTLGSEGRLDGIDTLGREMFGLGRDTFGLGRETLGLGRDMPPPGRDPPPIPSDGLAPPPPPPRPPPPPGPRPEASGTRAKLVTPASRMPSAIGFKRRIMILTMWSFHLPAAGGRRTMVTS
jgi:hypothetical protein